MRNHDERSPEEALTQGRHAHADAARAWTVSLLLSLGALGLGFATAARPSWAGAAATFLVAAGAAAALRLSARVGGLATAAARLATLVDADPETGMPGPRVLDSELGAALETAAAKGRPLAVVVVDVGDLLPLHVERGLAAGRLVLRQIALALDSLSFGRGGRTYRLHGGALAAVLPDTSHAQAVEVAAALEPSLELFARRNGGLLHAVAGAAVALPGDLPDDVLCRAEEACMGARSGTRGSGTRLRPV